MPITLSFSTLNALIQCPHTWLNKQMGLETVESPFMTEGKEIHRIISDHISGKDEKPVLKELNLPLFPIVERVDFDERLKLNAPFNNKYGLRGFVDGRNEDWSNICEIKSATEPWGPARFAKSPQWKLYGLMNPAIKTVTLITTPRDMERWSKENIKVFTAEITDQHRQEAREFVEKGIKIIETINEQILHEDQPNRACYYANCKFCGGNPQ